MGALPPTDVRHFVNHTLILPVSIEELPKGSLNHWKELIHKLAPSETEERHYKSKLTQGFLFCKSANSNAIG